MKVDIIVHDLSSNPIVRAAPFAEALEKLGYQVRISGLLINSKQIYEPFRDKFKFNTIYTGNNLFLIFIAIFRLYFSLDGNKTITFKPFLTTYFIGVLRKIFNKKYLHLDVEDNDIKLDKKSAREIIFLYLRGWRDITEYKYNKWLEVFFRFNDSGSSPSNKLISYYKGKKIITSPLNTDYKFSQFFSGKIKLFFFGSMKEYKGYSLLNEILDWEIFNEKFELHLIGDPNQKYFGKLKDKNQSVVMAGLLKDEALYEYINSMNISLALQNDDYYTQAQIPAKLIESLGCGKPVISTDVGDIKDILCGDKNCGWILRKNDTNSLKEILNALSNEEILSFSKNSIEIYNLKYSPKIIARELNEFF